MVTAWLAQQIYTSQLRHSREAHGSEAIQFLSVNKSLFLCSTHELQIAKQYSPVEIFSLASLVAQSNKSATQRVLSLLRTRSRPTKCTAIGHTIRVSSSTFPYSGKLSYKATKGVGRVGLGAKTPFPQQIIGKQRRNIQGLAMKHYPSRLY